METIAFKKCVAWQKGYQLTLDIYKTIKKLPREELYGLSSQIRRAAVSIPLNIAEGLLRNSKAEFARFLVIAKGSCGELETQLMLAKDLNYIKEEEFEPLMEKTVEIIKILTASIKTIKKKSSHPRY